MVTITSKIELVSVNDVQALLLSFESRLESLSSPTVNVDGTRPSLNTVTHITQRRQNNTLAQGQRGRVPFAGQNARGGRSFGRGFYRGRGGRFQNNRPLCQLCHVLMGILQTNIGIDMTLTLSDLVPIHQRSMSI